MLNNISTYIYLKKLCMPETKLYILNFITCMSSHFTE